MLTPPELTSHTRDSTQVIRIPGVNYIVNVPSLEYAMSVGSPGSPQSIGFPTPRRITIYSLKTAETFVDCYILLLCMQYLSFFMSLPFDDVVYRPSTDIIGNVFLICAVCLCILILPFGISTIPKKTAYAAHLTGCCLQVVSLAIQLCLLYEVLRVPEKMVIKLSRGNVMHVDNYIKCMSGVKLLVCGCGAVCSAVNTGIYGLALHRLKKDVFESGEQYDLDSAEVLGMAHANAAEAMPPAYDYVAAPAAVVLKDEV